MGPVASTGGFKQVPLSGELELNPLDMTQLKKALPNLKNVLPKELDLGGVFSVKALKFNGTLQDLALNGSIDGSQGTVRYGSGFQKVAGIPLTLSTDARYNGDKISLRNANLTLNNL